MISDIFLALAYFLLLAYLQLKVLKLKVTLMCNLKQSTYEMLSEAKAGYTFSKETSAFCHSSPEGNWIMYQLCD